MRAALAAGLLASSVLAACGIVPSSAEPSVAAPGTPDPRSRAHDDLPAPERPAAPDTPTPAPPGTAASPDAGAGELLDRPEWLGRRELPLRPDGFGQVQATPPELVDRRLPPPDEPGLPSPDGEAYAATVEPVPDDVAARSTWSPECPVGLDDLRYVTVTFWGFDDRAHTGELLVHASAADDLVWVFEQLYAARFPIEEMRVVAASEVDAPPTGVGNNTTAFVCRPAVGQTRWSDHAHGLAVDVNPFHNPYAQGDLVVPELASSYVDRGDHRPGMILPGDAVTSAFAEIGWAWGGNWRSVKDWMHFSASGR